MITIRQTELYCAKTEQGYEDFYEESYLVLFLGASENQIRKVLVKETNVDLPTNYYAWWSNEDNKFIFVYKERYLLEMAFAYGTKTEEEQGKGIVCPVEISLIN
jgi:hypothetical protein